MPFLGSIDQHFRTFGQLYSSAEERVSFVGMYRTMGGLLPERKTSTTIASVPSVASAPPYYRLIYLIAASASVAASAMASSGVFSPVITATMAL